MRRPMMAGNWKMNKTPREARELAQAILAQVGTLDTVDRVICPPFVALSALADLFTHSSIGLGAQNLHWEAAGAYTGEISAPMLAELVSYVIIGHSERRQFFGDTDETVQRKTAAALAHGLIPIVCVGETLAQNEAGETATVVGGQVAAALDGLDAEQVAGLVIAYEPIWAIGTGRAATAQQAQDICGGVVRAAVAQKIDAHRAATVSTKVRILYGGSTNPENIAEIMAQPDIDGALIGGAALKADSYAAMVRATAHLYSTR
ncbi:MAG: triose-phosphate isomerase [Litorilinea sp.]